MRSLILIVVLGVTLSNAKRNDNRNNTNVNGAIRSFQLKLLQQDGTDVEQHLVVSPFSIWALMAVLAEGTSGDTQQQLSLHIGSKKASHGVFGNVTKLFKQTSPVTFERTSLLLHHPDIVIDPNYTIKIAKFYKTKVKKIALQPQVAAQEINDYFKTSTHGRIGKVVEPDDLTDSRVILAETLYFKGSWARSFNVNATKVEKFCNDDGQVVGEVNMMYQRAPLGFSNIENLGGHVLELPYVDGDQFAMLVMLPYRGVGIFDMYLSLSKFSFSDMFKRLAEDKLKYGIEEVDVWLPRFKISTDASLVKPLTKIGIEKIFTTEADFSKMTNESVYVTNVIHKAEIEVTEKGTVASAVSTAHLMNRSPVPKFRADKPFMFIIIEKTSETILFSGIYSQPSLF